MTVINDYSHLSLADLADRTHTEYSPTSAEKPTTVVDPTTPDIVSIRGNGTRAPVFCIHPIDGLASRYGALAAHIDGEHPVYGVEASPAVQRESSLSAVASLYAEEIVAAGRADTVHLLGLQFGGLLAHAIGVALQGRGVAVDSLTLLASTPTHHSPQVQHDLLAGMGEDVDRSRAEELLAVATRNEVLASEHFPGVFVGNALVVSTAGSDAGAAWHTFVSGTVSKYEVPDATAFGIVGPLVNRFL